MCLDHLWTDPGTSGSASRVFLATDTVGQQLLCLLTTGSLALVKMEKTNDVSGRVIFGAARTVPAVDAVPLSGLDMILVLDPGGGLTLYSGAVRITKVLLPALPSPSLHALTLTQVLHTAHCTLHTAHCTLHTEH